MTPKETAELLTLAALVDNREVTVPAVKFWHQIIGSLDYNLAVEAVRDHFRTSTAYLMPVHVVTGVKRLAERRPSLPQLEPARDEPAPAGWDRVQELRRGGLSTLDAMRKATGE